MRNNRRNPEASSLRAFFQEQWETLLQLLDAWQDDRYQKKWEQERLVDAVETIVDATEPKLRLAESYQQRLRNSARELLEQVESLIDGLPPAVELTRESFVKNPWVSILFKTTSAMHRVFSANREVQEFFEDSRYAQCEEVFAVLFAQRREKRILGSELHGDLIVSGVEQTSVSFSGHLLKAPAPREGQVRSALKQIVFDAVIQFLRQRMTALRYEQEQVGKVALLDSWNNPDYYLERLLQQMHLPQSMLHLRDDQIRINSMGIKMPPDAPGSGCEVDLHELGIGDRPVRVVSLVRYPRAEMQAPLPLESVSIL